MSTRLAAVLEVLDRAYPPGTAEDWDAVGLVCGDPDEAVETVLLAVDPVQASVVEAEQVGAQLLVTHHPLLLRGVHSVAADTPKGRVVHRLVRSRVALYAAHTNADAARGGVNEALADLLGLQDARPLAPHGEGAGTGIGRVGLLPRELTLAELAETVAQVLPPTAHGVRVSGPGDATVRTLAVCGGAGDSLFEQVRASDADVYLTADLRHHPASEAREHRADGRPYLIDVSHWASEWPWLQRCRSLLLQAFPELTVVVSTTSSDPWTFRVDHPADQPADHPEGTP